MKNICIYASSSNNIEKIYFEQSKILAQLVAKKGWGIIFGAGMAGLMGAVAESALEHGAKITGIIPELLNIKNIVHEKCHELIVTKTMRDRKMQMEERADAFIALPGGFGTMEELLEIITLKQLKYHQKPVVILNINHYYDTLRALFEHIINERFAINQSAKLYYFTEDPQDAIDYIENYRCTDIKTKYELD